MRIFSKFKEEKELVLVFDIGSSSVGGALFEIQKSKIPKIILSIREPIIFENKIDTNKFLFLTIKSLETIASRICLKSVHKPSKIFCVLSSPFYASATRIIKLEKNISFLFTPQLADDLIKKEINLFKEEYLKKFSDVDNKIRLIELKNIKIMLNGYETSNPLDKKAKTLEMIIFISMSGEFILKEIEKTIFKHFHSKNINFSSFIMASFSVARDIFAHQDNFILVDISGEMTDVSIIKKNILTNSISYPLGRNFFIRNIANSLNYTLSEAKSIFSLYKDEHASETALKRLEPIMSKLKKEWLDAFQKSLINISDDFSVPSNIFITVDSDLFNFFSKIIKNEQFSQYNLTESEFKIIFLDSKALHNFVSFKPISSVSNSFDKDESNIDYDLFLAIESIYINRFIC